MSKIRLLLAFSLFLIIGAFSNLRINIEAKYKNSALEILETSPFLSTSYLEHYSVPSSKFKVTNNGGFINGADLSKAFDRDFNTYFTAGKENDNDFKNKIFVDFDQQVTLDKIAYQSDDFFGKGFPKVLTIYFQDEKGKDFEKFIFETQETTKPVLFLFNENITCKSLTLEFTQISENSAQAATAKEIIFYQPENINVDHFKALFDDYCQLSVNQNFNTIEKVESLRKKLVGFINYELSFKKKIERAIKVLKGKKSFDSRRQFVTNSDEEGAKIKQIGDLREYAENTLKFIWFGINKQTTGIQGNSNDKFTVFVDAEDEDPLPFITFSQYYGSWKGWQEKIQLKKGINELSFPTFYETSNPKVNAGGPIYIENPYTTEEQSSHVKVYIEGGSLFPVLRKGENEEEYKNNLSQYLSKLKASKQFDLTEIEGRNILLTIRASTASKIYNSLTEPRSPQENIDFWDNRIISLLSFYGIQFDKSSQHYDKKNLYLNTNVRLSQVHGSSYALTDYIGIFDEGMEKSAIYSKDFGWRFAYEIGYALDNPDRTVADCTNKMISKFDDIAIEKKTEKGSYSKILSDLVSDREKQGVYWNKNRHNYLIWWLLESHHIGYWGETENIYRYNTNTLSKTEKQIYYSSLVLGFDLSYYFERWGYNLDVDEKIFNYKEASNEFKAMMDTAIKEGKIKADYQPKIWYYDSKEYSIRETGVNLHIYNEDQNIKPVSISRIRAKSDDGKIFYKYSLVLPKPENEIAHLGYEILEGSEEAGFTVVGFSNENTVQDYTLYPENYIPTYIVKAYDRELYSTGEKFKTQINLEYVAKVGEQKFYSIDDALEVAKDKDTIYLIKDSFSTAGNQITKDITIKADPSLTSVIIYRGGAGDIIEVASGTLTIKDTKITFDGRGIPQSGALIHLSGGKANIENVTFQNGYNLGDGGAILKTQNDIILKNCVFKNNKAKRGGAIASTTSKGEISLDQTTFINNIAETTGGAISTKSSAKIYFSKFTGNKGEIGGAISSIDDAIIMLENSNISNNEAEKGGAISLEGRAWINHNQITENRASILGSAIYFDFARICDLVNNTIYSSSGKEKEIEDIYLNEGTLNINLKLKTVQQEKSGSLFVQSGTVNAGVTPKALNFAQKVFLKSVTQGKTTKLIGKDISIILTGSPLEEVVIPQKVKIVIEDLEGKETIAFGEKLGEFIPNTIIDSPEVKETEYVIYEKDGNEYFEDEKIPTDEEPMTIKQRVVKKKSVTLKLSSKDTKVYYVKKGEYFVLPGINSKYIPEEKILGGWKLNGIKYQKGGSVIVNTDVILLPFFVAKTKRIPEIDPRPEGRIDDSEQPNKGKSNIFMLLVLGSLMVCIPIVLCVIIQINRRRKRELLKNILTTEREEN